MLALAALTVAAPAARAGEPPTAPVLRVEAEMHTAMINRVATDAAGRWVVTASDDKTARVWERATGRPVRVLRPPLGPGNEGKLYAVALSPDGRLVAVGGWGQSRDHDVYLFDRATGALLARQGGHENVINHLAFDATGRRLAATLGGRNGLRLYAVEGDGLRLLARDADYGGGSSRAAFARDGRLVTSCDDGKLRHYGADGERLRSVEAPGGQEPSGVAFRPDGGQVAVGYFTTRVDVLDARSLAPLFAADTAENSGGSLSSVAFSADGRTLYAAGRHGRTGSPILAWAKGGRGARRSLPAPQDTVMDLVPLPGGGLLFGAADPAWGVLDGAGKRQVFRGPPVADFRDAGDGFRLAPDGRRLSFGFANRGTSPALLDLAARTLTPGADASRLGAPAARAPGLMATEWEDTLAPKLNGHALTLKKYETSRAVAVVPARKALLLGADWSLRLFAADGAPRWKVPVPGAAWAVNATPDGRLGVAAFGDGTLRWFRLEDGVELLAVYPHPDQKRWVAWTPAGYYDASPGAEALLGWHVNRGRDRAADFFPVARFRDTYARPDVVARVLDTLDEAEALRQADAARGGARRAAADLAERLPPVIELLDPTDGQGFAAAEVTVRYRVRSADDAPVTGVQAMVDGRPATRTKGFAKKAEDGALSLSVVLPAHDVTLTLLAENKHGLSPAASARLRWQGAAKPFVAKPKLYVLAVGVGAYAEAGMKLRFPAKDARDFAAATQRLEGGLYREVEVKLLPDAKRGDVLDGLEWLERQTTHRDVAMLFLSGHGLNDSHGRYYFLPADYDAERLKRTGVSSDEIQSTVQRLAGKTLVFLDSCHAANAASGLRTKGGGDTDAVVSELAGVENGAVVFTAATGTQKAQERDAWGNGAFAKAVIEGLGGAAAYQGGGRVTVSMLDLYVSERVKKLTDGAQTPVAVRPGDVPDFPIAVKR